ncbi:unnamed protein product [Phytophthora lilii]|uniref:Unnamed protein product n=1 Tax=Phytophthora lilii TaxID=2077276 RepID=A0A9W6TFZ0_9STRA|nr:unnamed protein product [Phytophthora lilii]
MYTPNSLKSDDATGSGKQSIHSVADHTGEAKAVTKKTPSLPDQDIPEDPSPEYVANLQRGPGVIKETLNEIDALIDNSIRLALSPPDEDPLGVELPDDVREFVREYERPLESVLPLSRTTDSWGEDASISLIDDDANRRSRDLDQLSNSTEPTRPTTNGVRRSRSQETPELDTIREGPCPSNTNSASRSQLSDDSHNQLAKESRYLTENRTNSPSNHKAHTNSGQANHRKRFNGLNSKSEGPKSRATSATLDQSLAEVAATQNPFRDEAYQETENVGSSSEVQDNHNEEDSFASIDEYRRQQLGDREDNESLQDQSLDSEATMNGVRFRYGENIQHSRRDSRKRPVDDHNRVLNTFKPRSAAVQKHSIPSDRVLDIVRGNLCFLAYNRILTASFLHYYEQLARNKLHVTMETAMQIVFTNGGNSVGRICVSLLPLSTGCQQFSVSPAVLELGPRASSAFHVTFNARYAGAVSGIVQFRGVGVDSLFHPYEVVIEASVQRRLELDHPKNTRPTKQREEVATSERVQELQASSSVDQVEVSPMFIRFDHVRGKSGEASVLKAKLVLANNTSQTLPFKVRALENLKVRPATGMIQPASEVIVSVLPISQPFVRQRSSDETNSSVSTPRAEDWFGSLTVRVGQTYRREVSVVTDSFYYTKRGKRRGLYFHARAVEFGCCNVGESHEVPVYVCNGSKTPMTVFLQDLQEPFSCAYSTTTIEPRKFIEVMVTFTPKVVGKVATSLFAYSVTDKAVVTLVARGI